MIDLRQVFPPPPAPFGDREPDDPDERSRRHTLERARRTVEEIVERGELPESDHFKNLWSDYKHIFRQAQFGGKCAFCESRIGAGQAGDVEHYRPKTALREPLEPGNRDDTAGRPSGRKHGPKSRPGYWWLAYEWSNYLFACAHCNRAWKRNSFPVRGERRSMEPGVEAEEEPLILNPFFTDPDPHLRFDEFGQVTGVTEEGRITVDRLGLDRQSLIDERFRVANKLRETFIMLEDGLITPKGFDNLIAGMCDDAEPYAGLARDLCRQWIDGVLDEAEP